MSHNRGDVRGGMMMMKKKKPKKKKGSTNIVVQYNNNFVPLQTTLHPILSTTSIDIQVF